MADNTLNCPRGLKNEGGIRSHCAPDKQEDDDFELNKCRK